ncbi:MAG: ribokinase, partial [Stellaceae bacterium]
MILVFGSINVDLIVPVPRLPETGETVLGGDYALLPGGKGANQALAARRAGSEEVVLVGAVGRDSFGEIALDLVRRDGVDTRLVRAIEKPTGCAAIMVSRAGENMIAVAPGANNGIQSDWVLDDLLSSAAVFVGQMEVPLRETEAMIRRVRRHGGRCLLNLAPALPIDLGLLPDIDFLVANENEARTMGADPMRFAGRLRQGLVVTRGAVGATALLANGTRFDVPALAIDPMDTTGAGDTFVGAFAAALDAGLAVKVALRRANAAAGLACL